MPSIWPAWARQTASAAAGAGLVLVALTIAYADVKRNAETGANLAPRVETLERHEAEDRARFEAEKALLQEIRADVKRLLERK